jgi:hypothetical protein
MCSFLFRRSRQRFFGHPTGELQARERQRTEERAQRVTSGMKFGGYSVAADVGCAVYSLQETKRGSGQDEWTMRDKIPVPGSSS